MEIKSKVIIGTLIILIILVSYDMHLYLFDRSEFLLKKSSITWVEAENAYRAYNNCITDPSRNKKCKHFKASYVEKMGEYNQVQTQLEAWIIRNRKK